MSTRTDIFNVEITDTATGETTPVRVTIIQMGGRVAVDSLWKSKPTPEQIDAFQNGALPLMTKAVGIPIELCKVARIINYTPAMTRAFFGGGVG